MVLRSSAKIGSFDVSSCPVAAMILRHRRKLQLQWDEDLRLSPMLSFRLANGVRQADSGWLHHVKNPVEIKAE